MTAPRYRLHTDGLVVAFVVVATVAFVAGWIVGVLT